MMFLFQLCFDIMPCHVDMRQRCVRVVWRADLEGGLLICWVSLSRSEWELMMDQSWHIEDTSLSVRQVIAPELRLRRPVPASVSLPHFIIFLFFHLSIVYIFMENCERSLGGDRWNIEMWWELMFSRFCLSKVSLCCVYYWPPQTLSHFWKIKLQL